MEKFEVTILGCGAALPTPRRLSSSQVVNIREKLFLLDCAEGVQMALRRKKMKFSHINAIFITHLHGDHCFGLIGLISTLGLLGRRARLDIYGPAGLKAIFQPQIDFFCEESPFEIVLNEVDHKARNVIYDDRSVSIETIPLSHRVPCCGYLFREKPTLPHIKRDAIEAFGIPTWMINRIKAGEDYVNDDGETIANELLTTPGDAPRSYAYCTDTTLRTDNAEQLNDVTLLYHEATFTNEHKLLARQTHHSTAQDAAKMAQLAHAHRLVLGHFSSRYLNEDQLLKEAKELFNNTLLAEDGKVIAV